MTGRDSPAVGVSARAAMALGNVALCVAARPGGQPT
ncbi:MAG: hypothetical protein QOI70_1164, partial [Microbacteriaceae bacterium]|nr:hypothetical protein [Microbacteriaceae bacterium]